MRLKGKPTVDFTPYIRSNVQSAPNVLQMKGMKEIIDVINGWRVTRNKCDKLILGLI